MAFYTQSHEGTSTTTSATGTNELFAREAWARGFKLSKLPPQDVDVTKGMDDKDFVRFTFNEYGLRYFDIINGLTEMSYEDKTMVSEIYEDNDSLTTLKVSDEDVNYIIDNYSKELKERISSKEFKSKKKPEPAVQEELVEVIKTEGKIIKDKDNTASNAFPIPDVARQHIDDNFMKPATTADPVVLPLSSPIKVQPAKTVKPAFIENLKARLDSSSPSTTAPVIYSMYPYIKEVEDKIKSDGVLTVGYEMIGGIIKMKVSSLEKPDEVMDNYSMTFDLSGLIVSPYAKWWPGINHDSPIDFKVAYNYDANAIALYLAGEAIPEKYESFNEAVASVNKIVDLRTIFNIKGISDQDAKLVMKAIKDGTDKISTRLEKDCKDMRFSIEKYTDTENFDLITSDKTYDYVGGKQINSGAAVRLQIASKKAPKLLK